MSKRTKPLQLQDFQKLLDDDGRLVDESILRKTVFLGILIYYQVFKISSILPYFRKLSCWIYCCLRIIILYNWVRSVYCQKYNTRYCCVFFQVE